MEEIEKDRPLSGHNGADGRFTWPERWKSLKKRLDKVNKSEELIRRFLDSIAVASCNIWGHTTYVLSYNSHLIIKEMEEYFGREIHNISDKE